MLLANLQWIILSELTLSIIQEMAVELIFAAHSTTASASTSLILQLMRHSEVTERARAELEAEGLIVDAPSSCCLCCNENSNTCPNSEAEKCTRQPCLKSKPLLDKTTCSDRQEAHRSWINVPYLSLEKLNQLCYLDCVVKELLRFLPPVSGGYRTVLQTFELNVSGQK